MVKSDCPNRQYKMYIASLLLANRNRYLTDAVQTHTAHKTIFYS